MNPPKKAPWPTKTPTHHQVWLEDKRLMTLRPFSPCFLTCRWRGHLCTFLCFKSTQRSTLWWHNTSFFRWWCTSTHRRWDDFFGQVESSPPTQDMPMANEGLWAYGDSLLEMYIKLSWWWRLHPCCGLDPIHGTFLVGDVRSILSWDSSPTSPFISKQASKHSGYVFLCRLSWICGGTRNCGLFVATRFSWETWLGMVKMELCLGAIWPPNASFSVRNSAGFGGFHICWRYFLTFSESVPVILSTRITRLSL